MVVREIGVLKPRALPTMGNTSDKVALGLEELQEQTSVENIIIFVFSGVSTKKMSELYLWGLKTEFQDPNDSNKIFKTRSF